jgi:hypothetical protein
MAPIDNAYTDVWRGVLRHVLAWPDAQIASFVDRWQAVEDIEGPNSYTHDFPTKFVVPLCIPEDLRTLLRTRENHAFERFDMRLQDIVTHEFETTQRAADVDWTLIKADVVAALSEFGYELPTPEASFNYWVQYRMPGLDRGEVESSGEGD